LEGQTNFRYTENKPQKANKRLHNKYATTQKSYVTYYKHCDNLDVR